MAHDLEKKWRSKDVQLDENVDFSALLLCDSVLQGLQKARFKKPSPIQLEAIPLSKIGKDLIVQAKSGTGKTLVFVITALEMLRHKLFRPQVMILVPTREIATQICEVVRLVGSRFKKLSCHSFIGGISVSEDAEKAKTCQIVVGTPGRLKQLVTEKMLYTNSIRLLVFDEADELLKISFKQDITDIFNILPEGKQVIATSATYPSRLKKLLFKYLREPYIACLNSRDLALLGIIHYATLVKSAPMLVIQYKYKVSILETILKTIKFSQCLVFCNGIQKVEILYKDIKKWGFSVTYISSAKEQSDRLKAMDRLKHFKCRVLVSSDLTSRGIDAENVDLVVNFDLAFAADTYMHRVGRAGRYGSVGVCISIVEEKELKYLQKMEAEASFKTYILPDPIPANIIQKPVLEKYVITVTESEEFDSEPESFEPRVLVRNANNGIEEPNTVEVEKKYPPLKDNCAENNQIVEKQAVKNILDASENVDCYPCLSRPVNVQVASDEADKDLPENIKLGHGENCCMNEAVECNLPDKDNNMSQICRDSGTEDISKNFEFLVQSENVADLNSESIKDKKTNIEVDNINNCLDGETVKSVAENLFKSVHPSHECEKFEKITEDVDLSSVPDSDIFVSGGLKKEYLDCVIKSFLDKYELDQNIKLSDLNENEELEAQESVGSESKKSVSVCAINDLNSKKKFYVYNVCKQFQSHFSDIGTKQKETNEISDKTRQDSCTDIIKERLNQVPKISCGEVSDQENFSSKMMDEDVSSQAGFASDSINKPSCTKPFENPKFEENGETLRKVISESIPHSSSKLKNRNVRKHLKSADMSSCLLVRDSRSDLLAQVSGSDSSDTELSKEEMPEKREESERKISEKRESEGEGSEKETSDDSQDLSSSEDSDEESNSNFSDSSSSSAKYSYHHNIRRNPSSITNSVSLDRRSISKHVQSNNFSKYPHSSHLKSDHRIYGTCMTCPQHPANDVKSKVCCAVPKDAFTVWNHPGHSTRHSIACGSSCCQPSDRRYRCDTFGNPMQVCSDPYKTFYSQWKYIQSSINSAMK